MPSFFATCPKGLEDLLVRELQTLGVNTPQPTLAGVRFEAERATALKACLWTRIASRVIMPVSKFEATTPEALYAGALETPWEEHLDAARTFRVDAVGGSETLNHTRYAALKVKDAIADRFRKRMGRRPSVDTERPDVRFHVHMADGHATLSVDLSGESLHRRGYRLQAGEAPIKETLAAGILMRAGWSAIAAQGGDLADPMCGAGTFLCEGALMASDTAPGLFRASFGFMGWNGYDATEWKRIREEAMERREKGAGTFKGKLYGFDADLRVLERATANLGRAGWGDRAVLRRRPLGDWLQAAPRVGGPGHPWGEQGLLVVNPPYGERLGTAAELPALYAQLGSVMTRDFKGWEAAMITATEALGRRTGLRARKRHRVFNGALPCELLLFSLGAQERERSETEKPIDPERIQTLTGGGTATLSESAVAFRNRLAKMAKHHAKWAKREGLDCYRVYDADLPDYNLAIDLYGPHVVIQEYEAPPEIPAAKVEKRLQEALLIIPEVLGVPRDKVSLKTRRRDKGGSQYARGEDGRGEFMVVAEQGQRFRVNLTDYLDTGLFLDHRLTRKRVRAESGGKDVLNLFGYTGSFTVYAAAGGAKSTTTVDLSRTYLDWADQNLRLNGFTGPEHRLVQADCMAWLEEEARGQRRYDLIVCDPPTFSNSKRTEQDFEVQRDHGRILMHAATLLKPEGAIYFSTNFRRFKLDEMAVSALGLQWRDITSSTIPQDFKGNAKIHRCWRLSRAAVPAVEKDPASE